MDRFDLVAAGRSISQFIFFNCASSLYPQVTHPSALFSRLQNIRNALHSSFMETLLMLLCPVAQRRVGEVAVKLHAFQTPVIDGDVW
jgi:hypothetical protein